MDPSQYLADYPAAFAPLKGDFDLNAIQQLYSDIDFIGISSYASNTPDFSIDKLESATYQFSTEIASFGVDIPDLIFNQVSAGRFGRLLHVPSDWQNLGWHHGVCCRAPFGDLSALDRKCSAVQSNHHLATRDHP